MEELLHVGYLFSWSFLNVFEILVNMGIVSHSFFFFFFSLVGEPVGISKFLQPDTLASLFMLPGTPFNPNVI